MSRAIKAWLGAAVRWPPLNRMATGVLRGVLPSRACQHPQLARFAPRVGVVAATLPTGAVLRVTSRGDDEIASHVFWRGWAAHEPETSSLFWELARGARVTLDIGAHVGYYALLAAHANPQGAIFAFEPLKQVRERLEENVALNRARNVMAVPFAAGSRAGSAELFHVAQGIPSTSSLSQRFVRCRGSILPTTSSVVEMVTLDAFVRAGAITEVDLVKIDTETTEANVLRGMRETLRRDRPSIICEVLEEEGAAAIEALLAPLGYEFFMLTADGPVHHAHIRPDLEWRNFLFRAQGAAEGEPPPAPR